MTTINPINQDAFLSAFFSDETENYLSPQEPKIGKTVTVRLRTPKRKDLLAYLILNGETVQMKKRVDEKYFSIIEFAFKCPDVPAFYYFLIKYQGKTYVYQKTGIQRLERTSVPDGKYNFCVQPGFHIPAWAKGAVQYQIFTDRFNNGDKSNDVVDGEYSYNKKHIRHIPDWYAPPEVDDYRCFYGGDIAGILQKLDYIQGLGVEVIYLNPIFLAPSSHKYDTQDYEHIDPHFGVIEEDEDHVLQWWEHHNGYARKYIKRVLSEINLNKSDELFAKLCKELHKRGMKIILDGVFNHCGSYHRWMDREGIYRDKPGFVPGAFQSEQSPYREYFNFNGSEVGYEAWWNVETLPKLNYEQSEKLCEEIFSVAEKWLKPPYSIDGWRLDVGADIAHSEEFNHAFWREFRSRVKAINPDALILAEHYGDPSEWLKGDQWDTVMNYDAFMEPVTYFLTGMEKHSDGYREDLLRDGERFYTVMQKKMARFTCGSLQCAMNELSNHDHSRFLTRTNRKVGRLNSMGAKAAGEGIDKSVLRAAVVMEMTIPGAPTIYYGDEAGQVGWTDPDNRRTYPWGREDVNLISFHKDIIALRKAHPVLRTGSFKFLGYGDGYIAFARFDKKDYVITVVNNGDSELSLSLRLRDVGAEDGDAPTVVLTTDKFGYSLEKTKAGTVVKGETEINVAPNTAMKIVKDK
ncbi:MAG: glycoside hydrolase family 13 protein [Clostridia bacterium]|nr:glycoside hydrolase family 13 protein [Clostridia bacterium]